MGRRGGRPARRVTRDAVRHELLVFVEGRRTEEHYIVHWHRKHRENVLVTVDPFRGGPRQLIDRAVEAKKRGDRDARRRRGRPYDEIWCFFDVDEHHAIDEVEVVAAAHGIKLAVSNPCLELWFILHFQDQTAHIDRHSAQSRSEALLSCSKCLSESALDALESGHDDATSRAQKLDFKHHGDGSPPRSNPSSGAWELVDSIRGAKNW